MAQVNKTTLKSYFETGDSPTEANFEDLIDSLAVLGENNSGSLTIAEDQDEVLTIGRGKIGYNGTASDQFYLAHIDHMDQTNYGFSQAFSGATNINSGVTNVINLRLENTVKVKLNDDSFRLLTKLEIDDAKNVKFGTTTGTKIGEASTQKMGFWGATPIVQPSGANQAALTNSTGGTGDGTLSAVGDTSAGDESGTINDNFTELYTLLTEIRTALVNAGLIKGGA